MMSVRYLTTDEVMVIHAHLAANATVRDHDSLGSAVMRPQSSFGGVDMYTDVYTKASSLFLGILMNHPFTDGNKRTAWLSANVFLRLNGSSIQRVSDDVVVDFIVSTITQKYGVEEVTGMLSQWKQ